MTPSRMLERSGHIALLAAGIMLFAPVSLAAQEATEPENKSETKEAPVLGQSKDGDPGPATVEERDRILADLYDRLSSADSPEYANVVETAIEKMWLFSGSDTIDLLMSRVRKTLAEQKTPLSLELLDAVVKLAPKYAEGWNRRAFVHFSKKNYTQALGDLRQVLSLDPKHFKAMGGLAVIMRELGKDEASLKAFRKALEVNPLDLQAKRAARELEIKVEGQGI